MRYYVFFVIVVGVELGTIGVGVVIGRMVGDLLVENDWIINR